MSWKKQQTPSHPSLDSVFSPLRLDPIPSYNESSEATPILAHMNRAPSQSRTAGKPALDRSVSDGTKASPFNSSTPTSRPNNQTRCYTPLSNSLFTPPPEPEQHQHQPHNLSKHRFEVTIPPSEEAESTGPCSTVTPKSLMFDTFAGFLASLTVCVCILSFASSVTQTPRFRPYTAIMVQMVALGSVLGGIVFVRSRLPYTIAVPDLFVCPFFYAIANQVDEYGVESSSLLPTFMLAVMISLFLMATALLLAGELRILRIGEFTPFPVVSGLLAGTGVNLAKQSFCIQTNGDFESVDLIWFFAAVATTSVLLILQRHGVKLGVAYMPTFASAITLFYASLYLLRSYDWAWDHKAFLQASELKVSHFSVWSGGILESHVQIDWAAILSAKDTILSYLVLNLLRVTLQYQALPQAVDAAPLEGDDEKAEMRWLAVGHYLSAFSGSFGSVPFLATMSMIKDFGANPLGPGIVCTVFMSLLYFYSFKVLHFVPKFVFSALLLHAGVTLMHQWLIIPLKSLSYSEGAIVITIVTVNELADTTTAIFLGAMVSVCLFTYQWFEAGCIKYESSGLMWHSSVERSEADSEWLESHGDRCHIIQLQGFIFFGNATSVVRRVSSMVSSSSEQQEEALDDTVDVLSEATPFLSISKGSVARRQQEKCSSPKATMKRHKSTRDLYEPDPLEYIILDLTLVMGLDASAIRAFQSTVERASKHGVEVVFSGMSEIVGAIIDRSAMLKPIRRFDDLDSAMTYTEDAMLKQASDEVFGAAASRARSESTDYSGFQLWLYLAEKRHGFDTAVLTDLGKYTVEKLIKRGQVLMDQQNGSEVNPRSDGLFFIASGLLSKKRDPTQSFTTTSKHRLLKIDRSALQMNMREFRFARYGPGWCVGLEDLFTGHRTVGVFEAETDCLIHFLSFQRIANLKTAHPQLVMNLYELLGRMMTRQFNRTKERLGHVTDSLFTTADSKGTQRVSRRTLRLVGELAQQMA